MPYGFVLMHSLVEPTSQKILSPPLSPFQYLFALWAWLTFLGISSAPMQPIKKSSYDNKSGIIGSIGLTNYGRAGFRR
jgi:hypothetical protein